MQAEIRTTYFSHNFHSPLQIRDQKNPHFCEITLHFTIFFGSFLHVLRMVILKLKVIWL